MQLQNNHAQVSITLLRETRNVHARVSQKLASYREFKPGWNFGEGATISEQVIETVADLSAYSIDRGFLNQDCFPGLRGEVLLALYPSEETEIEIAVTEKNGIELLVEKNDEYVVDEYNLGISEVQRMIDFWRNAACRLFASSTYVTITPRKEKDSKAWRSAREIIKEYQFAAQNAPFVTEVYAGT